MVKPGISLKTTENHCFEQNTLHVTGVPCESGCLGQFYHGSQCQNRVKTGPNTPRFDGFDTVLSGFVIPGVPDGERGFDTKVTKTVSKPGKNH